MTELTRVHDLVEFGSVEMDLSDIKQILEGDGESWLALREPDGVPVGFAHVQHSGECDSFVDPTFDPELRPALLAEIVTRARALGVAKLQHWAGAEERLTTPALVPFGFQWVATTWHLRHDLSVLTEPVWPDGATLEPFDLERDGREVWTMVTEAFRDTGFSRPRPYEEWARLFLDDGDVLSARRAGELVGCAILGTHLGNGYVRQLAVVQTERGRGLGRALLREAFLHDHRKGLPATTLSVDGGNDSARRLYDSVGMTVTQEFRRWDLTL